MQLFSSKQLSYLGVDLGNAGIKIVELKNENGRPRLVTYGYADLSVFEKQHSLKETEKEISEIIRKVCSKARTTTKKAIVALPNFSVFSSVISLPEMKKNEFDKAVTYEAKKFIPLPLSEMNLYSEIIGQLEEKKEKETSFEVKDETAEDSQDKPEEGDDESQKKEETDTNQDNKENKEEQNKGNKFDEIIKKKIEAEKNKAGKKYFNKVLVVAAPKKNVERYMRIFSTAGLELLSVETESFALERSLVGYENIPIMIVDIGAVSSDLTVVEKGIPVLNRSVDTGGVSITRQITQNLNIDFKRAEQFKRDIGFSGASQGVPKIIESSIEPVVNEIKYCFDLYSSQENQKVEKIILTGGSSYLPGLTDYLSKLLSIKVVIGDPWNRVIYPLELKSVLDEIGPKFSVAIGLAMREIV